MVFIFGFICCVAIITLNLIGWYLIIEMFKEDKK